LPEGDPGTDDEGYTSLSIDLHGHLASILSLATKAKRPLNESGLEIGYMKLVAGARSQLWRTNFTIEQIDQDQTMLV
jgi:hypothetical protein